jgi:serine/threonine protein kinase
MRSAGRGTLSAAAQTGRRFQFLQEIASGGFGSVYLTKMLPPGGGAGIRSELVAVKLLHRRWSDNAEISSRMRDEARLLAQLRHENIVEVLDFVKLDGRSAIVMELLDAVDSRVLIDHCREVGARVPLAAALEIMASVSSALDAAYNRPPAEGVRPLRVIHRDIKPSNIMVDGRGRVKVLDFGVARAEFDTREAKTAELAFGSLEYMPPERLFFEPESAASDIYSLGTALYELLALEHLGKAKLRLSEQDKFLAERLADLLEAYPLPPEADAELEADLVEVLQAMLAFDEARRPTAAQAAELLRALASRAGLPTLPEWAISTVPALVEAAREATHTGSGTLSGQTLTEDPDEDTTGSGVSSSSSATELLDLSSAITALSRSLQSVPGEADRATSGDPTVPLSSGSLDDSSLLPKPSPGAYGAYASEDHTVRDDTRWNALKRATLASLHETNEMGPLVVEEARRNRPSSPLEWLDNDEDLEGAPTVRIMTHEPLSSRDMAAYLELPAPESSPEADTLLQPSPVTLSNTTAQLPPPPPRQVPSNVPSGDLSPVRVSQGGNTTAFAMVPLRPSDPDGSSASSLGYLISAGMLLATSVVIFLTVLFVGAVGIAAMSQGPGAQPTPTIPPLVRAPSDAEPPAGGANQAGAGEPAARFVSNMAGTRRMMVRCGEATGAGTSEVLVPGAAFSECTVTAVDGSRHRRTAVLTNVEARAYQCFVGADSTCR